MKQDNDTLVDNFYTKAKSKQKQLDILFNVSFTAQGLNDDGSFYVPQITYELADGQDFVLPVVTPQRTMEQIRASDRYESIQQFASARQMSELKVFEYTSKVVDLTNRLGVGKIFSSPRVGHFIVFHLSDQDQVVFIPDTLKVSGPYWKKFFKTGTQLAPNWYYKKSVKGSSD